MAVAVGGTSAVAGPPGPNQPPVNTVPANVSVPEDGTHAFSGTISIADPDAGGAVVQLGLTSTMGSMNMTGMGVTFLVGDGVVDTAMTVTGTIAQINASLQTLTFSPNPNFSGNAVMSVTTDDLGNTGTGGPRVDNDILSLTVTPTNDNPRAVADSTTVIEDAGPTTVDVLANDSSSPDLNETLTVIAVTQPSSGVAAVGGGGTNVTVMPGPNFYGQTSFTYTISDGNGGMATATVTVNVSEVNDPPMANDDAYSVPMNSPPRTFTVLQNDTSLPDPVEPLQITGITQPATGGSAQIGVGGITVIYSPPPSFMGTEVFTYEISDDNGATDVAEVTITVGTGGPDRDGDGLSDDEETGLGTDPDDADSDDDGVADGSERMPGADTDGDAVINALDPDSDNDGLFDGTELGVTLPNADTDLAEGNFIADADPTTTTDPLDADTDDGSVSDGDEDTNRDGEVSSSERDPNDPTDDVEGPGPGGDDDDGDGVLNGVDNCIVVDNPDQADQDGDGLGDACDADADGNGFEDTIQVSGGGGCSTTPGSSGLAFAFLVLGLAGLARRQWLLVMGALVLGTVTAQAQAVEPRDFGVERLQLATDRGGILGVEGAESRGYLKFDVALWIGYANDPLVLYRDTADGRERVGSLVNDRVGGALTASLSPTTWLTVGFELPLVFAQSRDRAGIAGTMLDEVQNFGAGNLRVVPKFTVLRQQTHGVALAIIPAFTVPTLSSETDYYADDHFGFEPMVALSRSWTGWRVAANAGYRARTRKEFLDLVVDDELFLRGGLGYRFGDTGGPPVGLDVTLSTATAAADPFGASNRDYLEAMFGVNVGIGPTAILFAGTGAGLREGFGTPDWRLVMGLRIGSAEGVVEKPVVVVPVDDDQDDDGILDAADQCPTVAGIEELRGCPPADSDGDGLVDHKDSCPKDAEDKDSFADEDGCPEPDNDEDGVVDVYDRCPLERGIAENAGCPDTDRDGDSVVDRLDNCPDVAGQVKYQGCPKKQLVTIGKDRLEILESVYFKTSKAEILKKSFKLLDNVAAVLQAHPNLVVEVQGHTDSKGNDNYNRTLSQKRADAVREYLVKKGVGADRLTAMGYGEDQPVASNSTTKGRAQNRRVVFSLVTPGRIQSVEQGPDGSTE